ncbi:MAG: hypothetical protein SFV18_16455 [Bryobacteraceae bacterium]|nr:hypothetical protein [Bryobacteraceae bacterium]
MTYPIELTPDSNQTLLVTFPDVPEAATSGKDRADALKRALDALETAFIGRMAYREPIPDPSPVRRNRLSVALPPLSVAKLRLYREMRARRINKTELARRLGWHLPQVDRVLDLRHSSRLDQIEAALRAVGLELQLAFRKVA